jgi:hypothetical protein
MQPEQNQPPPPIPPKKSNIVLWIVIGCGTVLLIGALAFGGLGWWVYHKAKSYAKDVDLKNMPELWSDVPKMPGMTDSQHVDMSVAMKLLARPILDKMMSGVNDGKDAGQWDWTGYSISAKSVADVQQFYTSDRMAENGWQSEGGCSTMNSGFSSEQLVLCAFQKQNDQTGIVATLLPCACGENLIQCLLGGAGTLEPHWFINGKHALQHDPPDVFRMLAGVNQRRAGSIGYARRD